MEESYFVLYCSEDGDHYLSRMTEAQLQQGLDDHDWGTDVKINTIEDSSQINLDYKTGLYIFKGPLVVPKPKTVFQVWAI